MDEKGFESINVIPLVDVMLVLLTIVLTTSTFIAMGAIPVQLPKAESGETIKSIATTIVIDRQGVIFLDDNPLMPESLRQVLVPLDRDHPILIRADRFIKLQSFVEVLDIVKGLEFKKVSLQTEENP
ncbi:MAG: biopolymer transporter ExbD [Thermodesulfobacteriota bacterium]|jgi:biopolymer transport protein ExbD